MTPRLKRAIAEARRIRHAFVRRRGDVDLDGDCALTSLMLATELGDVEILRHAWPLDDTGGAHVWTVVDGVIVDITATQFNALTPEPFVRGVLVTAAPRSYHRAKSGVGKGYATLEHLAECAWYDGRDQQLLKRLLSTFELREAA